jgi:ribonuclease M5
VVKLIREVIIVEGKNDIAAVQRAVEAECLATGGFALTTSGLKQIEAAYRHNGIIILTDPDSAGERIRKTLNKYFPEAKHAFIPQEAATANNDIGIEQASSEAIRAALAKARCITCSPRLEFNPEDLRTAGLSGRTDAGRRRAAVGEKLGIGYANAKTFLRRLNHYGVTRDEFRAALTALEEENA